MEEKKQSKIKAIVEEFKTLKRSHQIMVIATIAAIVVLIAFFAKPAKTPFSKVTINATFDEMIAVHGKNYSDHQDISPNGYRQRWIVYPYKWLGYEGDLTIYYAPNYSGGWKVTHAVWTCDSENTEKLAAKIVKALDRSLGKGERQPGSAVSSYEWHDRFHDYTLMLNALSVYLLYE